MTANVMYIHIFVATLSRFYSLYKSTASNAFYSYNLGHSGSNTEYRALEFLVSGGRKPLLSFGGGGVVKFGCGYNRLKTRCSGGIWY
jgi:hypothetical protein